MKAPLTAADFSYQGCFKPQPKPVPADAFSRLSFTCYGNRGSPLALRIVNGERRFFLIGHNQGGGKISEFSLPATLGQTVATAPIAPLVNYWNRTPYTSQPSKAFPNGNINGVRTENLWWDEARQLLWVTFGDVFDNTGNAPTISYAKLTNPNGVNSVATPFGPWDLNSFTHNVSNVRGWLMEVPPSVRAFNGNRRLVVGNRFDSILGSAYFGHSMIAFDEPQDTSVPTANGYPWGPFNRFSAVTYDVLKYGRGNPATKDSHGNYNYLSYTRRAPDYSVIGLLPTDPPQKGAAGGTNVNPSGGVGYCQSVDIFHGGCWVETASKAGVVVAGGQASGKNWYTEDGWWPQFAPNDPNRVKTPNDPRGTSGWYGDGTVWNGGRIGTEFFNPAFYLYSEQDLINGARDGYGHYQLNPTTVRFPVSGPIGNWTFGTPVFDAATRRLYVHQDRAYALGSEQYPIVHCWEVLDTGTPGPGAVPSAPTNLRVRPI